ncbi:BA14K family protein [Bradyrhizobium sp. RDM4]|uniref:BA14K family protein n=1 Tax=Bradyrhizobium sp. RDM4 TaxID=3378765 RepID=UPI0038FC0023
MTSLKVLSAAAALALVLPMATPSFAQSRASVVGGGAHIGGGGGGGGAHFGGGGFSGGARMGGGGFSGGGAAFHGGGGNFAATAAVRPSGGATFNGAGSRSFATAGNTWHGGGGNWHGGSGNWHGGGWHHRGGFWPGFAAGAAIGGLGSYAYYGGGYYDDPYYYGDDYYGDGATVAVVPDTGGDSAAYCAQRYRSYDPASGTYLGFDGLRHPCP